MTCNVSSGMLNRALSIDCCSHEALAKLLSITQRASDDDEVWDRHFKAVLLILLDLMKHDDVSTDTQLTMDIVQMTHDAECDMLIYICDCLFCKSQCNFVIRLCGYVGQSTDDGAEDTQRDATISVRKVHAVCGADNFATARI